ncbi:MAG TPA: hypothetical protein VJR89_17010, partial [Polyangiales bacterium]|nr:hypothetical protein [Polyangiales bacterium]
MSIRLALLFAATLLISCSEFAERTQVRVAIDAEPTLRERIRYVDVEVRSGSLNADVLDLKLSRRLFPSRMRGWPLRFTLPRPDGDMSGYLVTATAKDAADGTLTVVRALSAYVANKSVELDLYFDEACTARATPCPSTFSCRAGECVDPFVPANTLPGVTADAPTAPAAAGEDGSNAAAAGSAAPSCGAGAGCGAAAGCSGAACATTSRCATRDDQGVCRVCPPGFSGDASDACEPVLLALAVERGTLEPKFDPKQFSYVVHVPLLQERLVLQLEAADAANLMVNGAELAADGRWTSPNLPLGDSSVVITLRAPGHGSRTYNLIARREGAQRAQPSSMDSSAGDEFGRGVAISGDRLVIGAPFEDGVAKSSGAAYVFERDGESWVQKGYLKAAMP